MVIDLDAIPFVRARYYTPAKRSAADLIVIHATQGQERAGSTVNVAGGFQRGERKASAHFVVDSRDVVQCVDTRDVAWHAFGVNRRGIGVEHCAMSEQTPEQWEDADSAAELSLSADLVAALCMKWYIPARLVMADSLRAQSGRGITTHAIASVAFPGHGGHWDPGPGFPLHAFIERVAAKMRGE